MVVSAALSTGELCRAPGLTGRERIRLRRRQRRLARAKRGSNRRGRVKHAIARLRARETDRRKDWAEKASTDIARRFDVIRVEGLQIGNMTRLARGTRENPGRNVRAKAGLNRGILGSGWGLLVRRLEDKAPGRVEKVKPHYTSQRCSACGQVDRDSRESQAVFRCTACGVAANADVNAAINIAAGHAVTARGGDGVTRPVNREPQLLLQPDAGSWIPAFRRGRMSSKFSQQSISCLRSGRDGGVVPDVWRISAKKAVLTRLSCLRRARGRRPLPARCGYVPDAAGRAALAGSGRARPVPRSGR